MPQYPKSFFVRASGSLELTLPPRDHAENVEPMCDAMDVAEPAEQIESLVDHSCGCRVVVVIERRQRHPRERHSNAMLVAKFPPDRQGLGKHCLCAAVVATLAFELTKITQDPGDLTLVAQRANLSKRPLKQVDGMVAIALRACE